MSYPVPRSDFHRHNARAPRAYVMLYDVGATNHCPGCNGTQWVIGRTSAECAHCGTALPLRSRSTQPMRPLYHVRNSRTAFVG